MSRSWTLAEKVVEDASSIAGPPTSRRCAIPGSPTRTSSMSCLPPPRAASSAARRSTLSASSRTRRCRARTRRPRCAHGRPRDRGALKTLTPPPRSPRPAAKRSARRVGSARASSASSAETPRIAAQLVQRHVRSEAAREGVAQRQQRRSRDRQAYSEPDGDDQAGLPARHRAHLAPRSADEPQQGQLAAALERDHHQRVDHRDRREGEDDHDGQRTQPAVGLAFGIGGAAQRAPSSHPQSRIPVGQCAAGAGDGRGGRPVWTRIVPSSGLV